MVVSVTGGCTAVVALCGRSGGNRVLLEPFGKGLSSGETVDTVAEEDERGEGEISVLPQTERPGAIQDAAATPVAASAVH